MRMPIVVAPAAHQGELAAAAGAPLARALLGKHLDDEVRVQTPAGERCYVIAEIDYPR